MAVQRETRLVGRIADAIHKKYPDAWVFKVHGSPYQRAGVPDLLVVVNGVLAGLEVKDPKPGESQGRARGRATLLQLEEIRKLHAAGAIAGVVLTPEEALELVDLAAFRGVIGN